MWPTVTQVRRGAVGDPVALVVAGDPEPRGVLYFDPEARAVWDDPGTRKGEVRPVCAEVQEGRERMRSKHADYQ